MDSSPPTPEPPLAPPRPFFLGSSSSSSRSRRSTNSDDIVTVPRPPPSSFSYPFPFQAYPGNPDPGLSIPGHGRRSSFEGIPAYAYIAAANNGHYDAVNNGHYDAVSSPSPSPSLPRSGSLSDLHRPPQAPFMASESGGESGSSTPASSSASIYRNSVAAGIQQSPSNGNNNPLPRSQSQTFRAPFLSPASRPSSSLWSWAPPADPLLSPPASHSSSALPLTQTLSKANLRKPLPSTLLVQDEKGAVGGDSDAGKVRGGIRGEDKDKKKKTDGRARAAWWITFLCLVAGAGVSAVLCWTGIREVKGRMLNEKGLCLVMDENWSSGTLDPARWVRDVELGGFGNEEFQMTTESDKNVYVQNGQLYIMPTLTKDEVPDLDQDGKEYTLDGCTGVTPPAPAPATPSNSTSTGNGTTTGTGNGTTTGGGRGNTNGNGNGNTANGNGNGNGNTANTNNGGGNTANTNNRNNRRSHTHTLHPRAPNPNSNATNPCKATTSYASGTVINPIMSGRISTKGKVSVKYGRVEVRAKVARGDWLWPAIWMLPENNTYGRWPLSGEMDILESRGNAPTYPAQGTNYVRSSLNYGLDSGLFPISVPGGEPPSPLTKQIYGWFALKRTSFDRAFHTYALEWDEQFVRFYVDSRVRNVLEVGVGKGRGGGILGDGRAGRGGFWDKGKFPATAQNASTGTVVVVDNPWEGGGKAAPFDQRFYLIINLAVGGTSGWFPDEKGDKPWYDGSTTAMRDFAKAQDKWYATWPENADDRAFRIESVKMWSKEC